ncbi:MAG TPA: hypothetical protein VNN17_12735 [Terriglobia bacterium]|nr:hypothetical protein [Terriglobia bacterium]
MATEALCALCHQRKAKRQCPGLEKRICPQCCGREREVSIDCPLDCSYLRESRRHDAEKLTALPEMPYKDIEVPERFLQEFGQIVGGVAVRLLAYFRQNTRVTDRDVLEAMAKLIQTYQTQQSGIYYESVPEEPLAAGVFRNLKSFFDEVEKQAHERGLVAPGFTALKDADVIRALVFLYRLAAVHTNRRPRGRAFLSFLKEAFPETAAAQPAPEEPRLILPGR